MQDRPKRSGLGFGQEEERSRANGTMSICARCPVTGELGFASLSAAMAAGGIIGTVRSGTASIASQGEPNPYLKFWIMGSLLSGKDLPTAMKEALARDPSRNLRQVLAMAKDGTPGGHTGRSSPQWSGHVMGPDYVVGGTRLMVDTVAQAMAACFIKTKDQTMPLAERLLLCLERGSDAGGTTEPERSAALVISGADGYQQIDLRVDDHDNPLGKLRILYADYMADDFRVDKYLATRENPGGKIPSQLEEALIYLRRHWLHLTKSLGLKRKLETKAPPAPTPLPGQSSETE